MSEYLGLVNKFNRFNASVESKDKLYKAVQCGARVLHYYLSLRLEGGYKNPTVAQLQKLDVGILDARRLFRIFRFTNEITKLAVSLKGLPPNTAQFWLSITRAIGYAGYFFINPISWFGKMGVVPSIDQVRLTKLSLKLWVIGLVSWILLDILQFLDWRRAHLRKRQLKLVSEEQWQQENDKKTKDFVINNVKNIADFHFASSLAGIYEKYNSAGFVGLCGFISACIASWQSWQAC